MTILRGYFAILLVLSVSRETTARELELALSPVAQQFGLTVTVRTMGEGPDATAPDAGGTSGAGAIAGGAEPWTVVVQGADHPGIVSAVTTALAEAGGNVVDLATHLVGEPDAAVYVMTMRALLPSGNEGLAAAQRVSDAATDSGVHCTITRDEADIL